MSLPPRPTLPYVDEKDEQKLKTFQENAVAMILSELGDESEIFWESIANSQSFQSEFEELFNMALIDLSIVVTRAVRQKLFSAVLIQVGETISPLGKLLSDDSITSVFLTDDLQVFASKYGSLHKAAIVFNDRQELEQTIQHLCARAWTPIDLTAMRSTAQLRNGWALEVVAPPVSPRGRLIAIRRHSRRDIFPMTQDDFVRRGGASRQLMAFLRAGMMAGIRILVIGHAQSGKTTLLNILSSFMSDSERIISIEAFAEFRLRQEHVVSLETREHFASVMAQISSFRPDRIVVGDPDDQQIPWLVDSGLKSPTYSTLSAWDAEGALKRMELALLHAFPDISVAYARDLIHRSFDLIVTMRRLPDDSRKVVEVVEVGIDKEGLPHTQLLFEFQQTGAEGGKIVGRIEATGKIPVWVSKIEEAGIELPENTFIPVLY